LIDFLYRPGIEACEKHENGVYAIKLNRMMGRERERERKKAISKEYKNYEQRSDVQHIYLEYICNVHPTSDLLGCVLKKNNSRISKIKWEKRERKE
jgi:hypothetical protein